MNYRAAIVSAAALLATLTACGSGSAPAGGSAGSPAAGAVPASGAGGGAASAGAAAPAKDPCTLVTSAQVAARTHRSMSAGHPDKTDHTVSCSFHATKGFPLLVVSAGYYLDQYDRQGMIDLVTQQQDLLSDTKGSAKNVPVSGIGEAALYVPGLGEATALRGGRLYYAIAWTGKDADSKTVSTALVKQLVQRGA